MAGRHVSLAFSRHRYSCFIFKRFIYDEIITKLIDEWGHTAVFETVCQHLIVFKQLVSDSQLRFPSLVITLAQVYPNLFFWVTYPFTVLLEAAWKQEYAKICKSTLPCPYIIEFVCMLERLLVYAHTGNTVVLHRSTMGSLSMIQGVLKNRFPTITWEVVHYPSGSGGPMRVDASC